MCLDKINVGVDPCKEGWKVFLIKDGKLYGILFDCKKEIPIGKWIHERNYRNWLMDILCRTNTISVFDGVYEKGFHVFHEYEDARNWSSAEHLVIKKVEVREPVATGYQDNKKVTVCKKIKVIDFDLAD